MLLLILSVLLILGALSAKYKVIDLFVALGFLVLYGSVGLFFNDIYPEAPIVDATVVVVRQEPHLWFSSGRMFSWVLEHGSSTANLILFSPFIYLGSKACSEIFQIVRKIIKISAS